MGQSRFNQQHLTITGTIAEAQIQEVADILANCGFAGDWDDTGDNRETWHDAITAAINEGGALHAYQQGFVDNMAADAIVMAAPELVVIDWQWWNDDSIGGELLIVRNGEILSSDDASYDETPLFNEATLVSPERREAAIAFCDQLQRLGSERLQKTSELDPLVATDA